MKKLLLFLLMSYCGMLHSQTDFCASEQVNHQYLLEHPEIAEQINAFNLQLSQQIKNGGANYRQSVVDGIYEIPVVVHIIHTGGAVGTQYNPSDAQVAAWINFTNNVYATTANGYTDSDVVPVRLVLAQRNPDCQPANGIVRVNGSSIAGYAQYGLMRSLTVGATQDDLRSLSRWPGEYFYNIYIVTSIDNNSSTTGFAYYAGAGATIDGAFMRASVVSTSATTLAHEMGHAFGLKHVFDGANSNGGECPVNNDCTLDNDMVCDTAPVQSLISVYPTPTNAYYNSCSGANYNGEQYNILNYGNTRNRFTQGQANRAVAQIVQFRQSLLSSKGGLSPLGNQGSAALTAACVPTGVVTPANYGIGPRRVTFGDINNITGGRMPDGSDYYIDFSAAACLTYSNGTAILNNATTALTVGIGVNNQNVKAYIDYNNDGQFNETNELVLNRSQLAANTTAVVNVQPPANAVMNVPLRMRVVSDFTTFTVNSCTSPVYGQIEDYAVTIVSSMGGLDTAEAVSATAYPNPFTDVITVKGGSTITSLTVIDINGRQVFTNNYNDNEAQANLSNLANGMYLLKVVTNTGSYSKKVVKK
jgi:hypothetical protein